MEKTYDNSINKLSEFKEELNKNKQVKRGKLYFQWIFDKTEKIQSENDEQYTFKNAKEGILKKYRITPYIYEKCTKEEKEIINRNYHNNGNNFEFVNSNMTFEDFKIIENNILFKRGNVVWINFGFNIGNEFGGIHPSIILKNLDTELFVVPLSSKMPIEYRDIENYKITEQEKSDKKQEVTNVIEIKQVYGFKSMTRWATITRMRKVSIFRVDFYGTVGSISGKDMDLLNEKIKQEF